MEIKRILLIIALVFYLQPYSNANETFDLFPPTLTFSEAKVHIENILISKGGNLKEYILMNVVYEYTKGEWIFFYDRRKGSHFIIHMNDKNTSIYRFTGGA